MSDHDLLTRIDERVGQIQRDVASLKQRFEHHLSDGDRRDTAISALQVGQQDLKGQVDAVAKSASDVRDMVSARDLFVISALASGLLGLIVSVVVYVVR